MKLHTRFGWLSATHDLSNLRKAIEKKLWVAERHAQLEQFIKSNLKEALGG
jgi:hypothetical protein